MPYDARVFSDSYPTEDEDGDSNNPADGGLAASPGDIIQRFTDNDGHQNIEVTRNLRDSERRGKLDVNRRSFSCDAFVLDSSAY